MVGIQKWALHLLGKCLKRSHISAPSTGFLWFKARSDHYSSPGTVLGLLREVHVCSASSSLAFTGRHTFAEVCFVFCPLSCGQPVRRKDNISGELAMLISKYEKKIKPKAIEQYSRNVSSMRTIPEIFNSLKELNCISFRFQHGSATFPHWASCQMTCIQHCIPLYLQS